MFKLINNKLGENRDCSTHKIILNQAHAGFLRTLCLESQHRDWIFFAEVTETLV